MKKKNYPMWQDEEADEMDFMDDNCDMEMPSKCAMPQTCMNMVLAHAYVRWQYYDRAFCPQEALQKGTLFPELWGVYPIPD